MDEHGATAFSALIFKQRIIKLLSDRYIRKSIDKLSVDKVLKFWYGVASESFSVKVEVYVNSYVTFVL